jgi:hypothetical protein
MPSTRILPLSGHTTTNQSTNELLRRVPPGI